MSPQQPIKGVSLVLFTALFFGNLCGCSRYSWMWYDRYDEVNDHMRTVNEKNCMSKAREDLVLRPDMVSQLPVYNQLLNRVWYRNRTSLIHLHNMALNRAFFYSYILQKMNDSASFSIQPNWLYMYMSAVADINANPYVLNGSALYFDTDSHYPNWYQTVPFNKTLKLFGPKAWRHDDTQDQGNFLREPTLRTTVVTDMGAGGSSNYTHPTFKMNPWYSKWLPDLQGDLDSLTKFTYYVGVKYSNETGKFTKDEFEAFAFFGPSSPSTQEKDERMLPVVFTQPYYDCGRYNNWIVSTVSPVVDYMPRYSNWTHMRRQR